MLKTEFCDSMNFSMSAFFYNFAPDLVCYGHE